MLKNNKSDFSNFFNARRNNTIINKYMEMNDRYIKLENIVDDLVKKINILENKINVINSLCLSPITPSTPKHYIKLSNSENDINDFNDIDINRNISFDNFSNN